MAPIVGAPGRFRGRLDAALTAGPEILTAL
jgi:hypothetical protein